MCNADPGLQRVGHWAEAEHISVLKLNLACVQVKEEDQWFFNLSSGLTFQQCSICARWSWRAPRASCVQKCCAPEVAGSRQDLHSTGGPPTALVPMEGAGVHSNGEADMPSPETAPLRSSPWKRPALTPTERPTCPAQKSSIVCGGSPRTDVGGIAWPYVAELPENSWGGRNSASSPPYPVRQAPPQQTLECT
jgi:hypothetical protein